MPKIDTLTKGAAALALGLALTAAWTPSAALADDQALHGASDIDIGLSGAAPEVVVRNVAANHHIDSLSLAVQGNTIAVGVSGYVDCTGTQFENWAQRYGHYLSSGAYGIGRSSLVVGKALPGSQSIDHTSDMDSHSFQLPVAKLAHPEIAVDPVAVVLAAAEQAPNKVQWLRQNHTLTVKIPLRWEAGCAFYTRNKITKKTVKESPETSYLTREVELKIKYQGDPQLFALNAQIAQGGVPDQLQSGPQVFKITSAQFQPSMPHHVGACPTTTTIRIYYQGQGKGEVRIRISAGNTPKHESEFIAFDSKDGMQHYDFDLETPKAYKNNINNTVMHNLRVYVASKGAGEQVWPSHYQLMDQAVWKTRCTPVVNPVLGGTGGKTSGYQQGGAGAKPSPALQLKQPGTAPAPRVIRRAQ